MNNREKEKKEEKCSLFWNRMKTIIQMFGSRDVAKRKQKKNGGKNENEKITKKINKIKKIKREKNTHTHASLALHTHIHTHTYIHTHIHT